MGETLYGEVLVRLPWQLTITVATSEVSNVLQRIEWGEVALIGLVRLTLPAVTKAIIVMTTATFGSDEENTCPVVMEMGLVTNGYVNVEERVWESQLRYFVVTKGTHF
ncbi:hypothetical protein Bbelb_285010 [Branchiostoma belcheri]|nr:hypothetical protein Bbelb_285010 [Branchiostoma belcheri]